MALLGEVAGAAALACRRPGPSPRRWCTDLRLAYLALGRVGPIVSRVTCSERGTVRPAGAPSSSCSTRGRRRVTTVIKVGAAPVDA